MNVNKITNNFNGIRINSKENKHCKYLYNKVSDIVTEHKIPATFATDYIDLPKVNQTILDKLKEFGVKIIKKEK